MSGLAWWVVTAPARFVFGVAVGWSRMWFGDQDPQAAQFASGGSVAAEHAAGPDKPPAWLSAGCVAHLDSEPDRPEEPSPSTPIVTEVNPEGARHPWRTADSHSPTQNRP